MQNRFLINRRQSKLMGVCAGLSDYTGIDVTLLRVAMVAGTVITGPVVPLFYVLTGWLAKDAR